jgi:hypothetical protein
MAYALLRWLVSKPFHAQTALDVNRLFVFRICFNGHFEFLIEKPPFKRAAQALAAALLFFIS